MSNIYGVFIGVFFGLWAGPVGIALPIVAFRRRMAFRWGALLGYVIGLMAAMLFYQVIDSILFSEQLAEAVAERLVDEATVEPSPALDAPAAPPSATTLPPWLIAAVPGGLIAAFGAVGAWFLMPSDTPEDELPSPE